MPRARWAKPSPMLPGVELVNRHAVTSAVFPTAGWSLGCVEKAQIVFQFGWKVLGAPLAPALS